MRPLFPGFGGQSWLYARRLADIVEAAVKMGCDHPGYAIHLGLQDVWEEILKTREHFLETGSVSDLPPLPEPVVRNLVYRPGALEPEVVSEEQA